MSATVPALSGMPHYNSDGYGSHLYVPWWLWDKHKELGFLRGYHIEVGGGYGMPGDRLVHGIVNRHRRLRREDEAGDSRRYGTTIGLSGRGEMIPNEHSFCEIDPDVKDTWGIPVLRFHWEWSDHELNQVRHMQTTFRAILEGMGGQVAPAGGTGGGGVAAAPRRPGAGSQPPADLARRRDHPRGRHRAHGRRSETSPLNKFCQAHEVKNLFVADAAPFVSNPDKNPTHTIVALAWRTAEYSPRN